MGDVHVIYANYDAVLLKELEHSWVLVTAGVREPIPHKYQGTTAILTLYDWSAK
jgi:hypothetical protein